MSCPYFYPLEPRGSLAGGPAAVLPLGDLWNGECRAEPLGPCRPTDQGLRRLCNLGYARGSCPRFPAGPELPDAVRFAIAGDQGPLILLSYVIERDHHPFAHGRLEYSRTTTEFASSTAGDNLARQARAYVSSYLRRKDEAAPL